MKAKQQLVQRKQFNLIKSSRTTLPSLLQVQQKSSSQPQNETQSQNFPIFLGFFFKLDGQGAVFFPPGLFGFGQLRLLKPTSLRKQKQTEKSVILFFDEESLIASGFWC